MERKVGPRWEQVVVVGPRWEQVVVVGPCREQVVVVGPCRELVGPRSSAAVQPTLKVGVHRTAPPRHP